MAKNDVRECRNCRYFEIDFDDGGICFSCKKGKYSKIHFFVDACPKFDEFDEDEFDEKETDNAGS